MIATQTKGVLRTVRERVAKFTASEAAMRTRREGDDETSMCQWFHVFSVVLIAVNPGQILNSSLTLSEAKALIEDLSFDKHAAPRVEKLLEGLAAEVAQTRLDQLHAAMVSARDDLDQPADCDTAADAMREFPDKIRQYMLDFSRSEEHAWGLCLAMMQLSYVDPTTHPRAPGRGESDFREAAGDALCAEVAMMRRDLREEWNVKDELDRMEDTAEELDVFSVKFYPETRRLLSIYAEADEALAGEDEMEGSSSEDDSD